MVADRLLSFEEVAVDRGLVYSGMGLEGRQPDGELVRQVEGMIAGIARIARPRFMYRVLPLIINKDRRSVLLGGLEFGTGTVITSCFADAEYAAAYVATTGVEFDRWLHEQKDSGDIMRQFVADAIGSAFAEGVGLKMSEVLAAEMAARGLRTGNSYSPGYCGWHVADQRNLFALLPAAPCGITLNDSCLMTPIKSVSGLVPVGAKVERREYGCAICDREACFRKKTG